VRLFIVESGIPVQGGVVDILAGAQPYADINPNFLVPLLEDGDLRLTEKYSDPEVPRGQD
jgi:glutathione S-transferase